MKKILAIIIVAVMIVACTVTVFADTTTVSYDFQPTYTVAIPASVTLGDAAVTADITASDVILEGGKKIAVELTSASNTASGSTFNAKNGDSAVIYTITGDEAISVGDTVAIFAANGSKTLTFSAVDKTAATVAGSHTETLTFTISVEDSAVAVIGITLDKTSLELTAGGDTATLTATVSPDDATDKTVTWSSDNKAVVTVSDGVVTPIAAGTATITAKAGDKTATCAVTVNPATVAVAGVTLNETSLELMAGGDTATLTATVTPDDATDKLVTWSSSDTAIATVNENGKVTPVAVGTATITATAGDKTAACDVTVTTPFETFTFKASPKYAAKTYTFSGTNFQVTGFIFVLPDNIWVYETPENPYTHEMTISSTSGKTIKKVIFNTNNINWEALTFTSGTYDGVGTLDNVNASSLTVDSTSREGTHFFGVTIYYE